MFQAIISNQLVMLRICSEMMLLFPEHWINLQQKLNPTYTSRIEPSIQELYFCTNECSSSQTTVIIYSIFWNLEDIGKNIYFE